MRSRPASLQCLCPQREFNAPMALKGSKPDLFLFHTRPSNISLSCSHTYTVFELEETLEIEIIFHIYFTDGGRVKAQWNLT